MDSILGLLNIHKSGQLFWRLMLDTRVSWLLKIYAWCGFIYFFSPLDVVPHDFTGIGLVDDIIVALVIMQALIEMAPPKVLDEHCEKLDIDIDKVFVPVPVLVRDAMEMFYSTGGGRGRGWMARGPEQETEQAPAEPPPYARYSAYREDQ